MTDTFKDLMDRIDRTSPSFNEALPALALMFKVHENKLNNAHELIDVLRQHFEQHVGDYNKRMDRLHTRIDFLEDRMTGMEGQLSHPRQTTVNLATDLESLTAYVHRLETLLNDIEGKFAAWVKTLEDDADIERKRIDRAHERLNQHRTDIDTLDLRVEDLEKLKLVELDNMPEPKRDTLWHPYDPSINPPPPSNERVVVMTRADYIAQADRAGYRNWHEQGDDTIVAWRYAKEGE